MSGLLDAVLEEVPWLLGPQAQSAYGAIKSAASLRERWRVRPAKSSVFSFLAILPML